MRRTSSLIPSGEEDWSVHYVGFASGGWSETAVAGIEDVVYEEKAARARRKWQAVGVQLVDLPRIDADLARWSEDL
ncbi:MAG TPA: hypothetical protein EYH05_02230 [Anaerolineae bacterium]|nr:hypothetical protein [Anaerolineae bacterium]